MTKLLSETYPLLRLDNLCNGEVLGEVTPRSYVVKTQDGLVRQNRIHLRPSEPQVPCDSQPLPEQPIIDDGAAVGNSAETTVPDPNSVSE